MTPQERLSFAKSILDRGAHYRPMPQDVSIAHAHAAVAQAELLDMLLNRRPADDPKRKPRAAD